MTPTPSPVGGGWREEARALRRRRRGLRSGQAVVGAFLVLLGLGIPLFTLSPTLNPADLLLGRYRYQPTPELLGLTQPMAVRELVREDLTATTRFAYSGTVDRGEVMVQRPAPEEPVRRNGTVELTVSRGRADFVLPNVVGSTEASVRTLLRGTGITVKRIEFPSEDREAGAILRQDPLAGEVLRTGDTLSLVVSQGPQPRKVPDVRRLPLAGAAFLLGNAGFVVSKVTHRHEPFLPEGAVILTNPPAGETKPKNTKVEIVLSDGPENVQVPELVGTTEPAALEALQSIGLIGAVSTELIGASDSNNGAVLRQDPARGTEVPPGSVVEMVVARQGVPG